MPTPPDAAWSDPEHRHWLELSARIGDFLRSAADRDDLIAHIGVDTRPEPDRVMQPRPAAAFVPVLAEARFDAGALLGVHDKPSHVDPRRMWGRQAFPALTGAICHEAAHAAHTRLKLAPDTPARIVHWALLLEEPRIEARQIRRRPGDRLWLRASTAHVVGRGSLAPQQPDTPDAAATALALLVLRADAGVLDAHDVDPLLRTVTSVLGARRARALRAIGRDALAAGDGDAAALLDCGRRWAEALGEDLTSPAHSAPSSATDGTEPGPARRLPCGAWTPGDLPEDATPWTTAPAQEGPGGAIAAAVRATIDAVHADAQREAAEPAGSAVPDNRAERDRETAARGKARDDAQQVFGPGGTTRAPIHMSSRDPNAEDRRGAHALVQHLSRARYRDLARTRQRSATPPGRLNVNEAMRRERQIATRVQPTATPWTMTRRRLVEPPPLTLGISLDVSGSMNAWTNPVASAAWMLAHAVHRTGGTVAAVAWNTRTTPIIAPHRAPAKVVVPRSDGGSSGCPQSLRALDGALELTDTDGARLLAVITDGHLTPGTTADTTAIIRRLTATGVTVLWVTWKGQRANTWVPAGAVTVSLTDTADFGPQLAARLVHALATA